MKSDFKNAVLLSLYENKGLIRKDGSIDFISIAADLENKGLRENTPSEQKGRTKAENDKTIQSKRKNTADTLRKHLNKESEKNKYLSGEWINIYCQYFKCSADYILGIIERPTHEKTDIHEVTGLSDQAIETLKDLHQLHDKNNGSEPDHLPIINQLLASRKEAMDLLHWLEILIYLDADLVIHKKGKNISPDKKEPNGFRLIHKDNPNAYTAIDVKDLIRANTYDKIKNTLADFINKYQK